MIFRSMGEKRGEGIWDTRRNKKDTPEEKNKKQKNKSKLCEAVVPVIWKML